MSTEILDEIGVSAEEIRKGFVEFAESIKALEEAWDSLVARLSP